MRAVKADLGPNSVSKVSDYALQGLKIIRRQTVGDMHQAEKM